MHKALDAQMARYLASLLAGYLPQSAGSLKPCYPFFILFPPSMFSLAFCVF